MEGKEGGGNSESFGIKMLCKLFNCIMNTEEMPSAWRQSILIPKVTSRSAKTTVVSNFYHTHTNMGESCGQEDKTMQEYT